MNYNNYNNNGGFNMNILGALDTGSLMGSRYGTQRTLGAIDTNSLMGMAAGQRTCGALTTGELAMLAGGAAAAYSSMQSDNSGSYYPGGQGYGYGQNNYNQGYQNNPNGYNQGYQNNPNGYNQGYQNNPNGYNQGYQNNPNGYNQGYQNNPNGYNQGYQNNQNGYNQGYQNNQNGYNQGYQNNQNGYNQGYQNNQNGFVPQRMPSGQQSGMSTPQGEFYSGGQQMQQNQNNRPQQGGGYYSSQTAGTGLGTMPQQRQLPPKRNRLPKQGQSLTKGQKYSVSALGGGNLKRLKIALGWDIKDARCELDASAFMLGANGKVMGDSWFIFYGQPESPDKSVKYSVYEDRSAPDDAAVEVDLDRVDPNVQKIVIAVTIYEAYQQRLNFGMTENVYARIVNAADNKELARFTLSENYSNVTALVLGELYRHNGAWKFNSVGSGVNRDLAGFCGMYGVELM